MNVLDQSIGEGYALYNGDSAEVLTAIPDASVDLAVFSPPFQSLYTYSPSERDLGNAKDPAEFWDHFGFVSRELARVMRPGRNVCVHVAQVASTKATHGVTGLFDFRGDTIRHFQGAGFTFHGDVVIDKDPQAQAIRTKSKALLFVQMERDAAWLRPALADYVVVMRAPGENAVPIRPELTRDEWIEWARPIWYGIRESDTLNAQIARADADERHIVPLQLGTIERVVRLWSNRGETVLSPFAGVGSEGVVALEQGRRFVGVELKPEYFRTASRNLAAAGQSLTLGLDAVPA